MTAAAERQLGLVPKREQSQRVGATITLIFSLLVSLPACCTATAGFTYATAHRHAHKLTERERKKTYLKK